MIRLIIKHARMCPDGSNVANHFSTVAVDIPELEQLIKPRDGYEEVSVIGAEVVPQHPSATGGQS